MDLNTIKKLKENFKVKNIDVEFFESLDEAKSYILDNIYANCSVGVGHSMTLQKMGITQSLIERGNIVYDKVLAKTKEESYLIKKKALITDWYITGSNAVSMDGRIVNIDHSGNRVAAITFGPDKVIIVVGKNKIVGTLDEAIQRVKNVACPLNAKRAGYNPPCIALNKCIDCISEERVCFSLLVIEGQADINRIKLVVINDELGF